MEIKYQGYEHYRFIQTETNKSKVNRVWVDDREIEIVAGHILGNMEGLTFGVCHGSRNGYEVEAFRRLLGVEVLGTDISETADQFPNMIVHDFHEVRDEWVGSCDFIYTNSLDHSYDPSMFLRSNILHLKPHGRLYIEHSLYHTNAQDYADCFGATLSEYMGLIRAQLAVLEVLEVDSEVGMRESRKVIVAGRPHLNPHA